MKRLVPKMWQGVDVAKKVAVNVLPLNRPKIHWKLSFWHPILDMIRHVWEVLSYMAKSNYRHLSRFFFCIYHTHLSSCFQSTQFDKQTFFVFLNKFRLFEPYANSISSVMCSLTNQISESKEIVRDFKSGRLMVNCKKRWHLEIMEHNYWLKA